MFSRLRILVNQSRIKSATCASTKSRSIKKFLYEPEPRPFESVDELLMSSFVNSTPTGTPSGVIWETMRGIDEMTMKAHVDKTKGM
jgi:hypothetical protein